MSVRLPAYSMPALPPACSFACPVPTRQSVYTAFFLSVRPSVPRWCDYRQEDAMMRLSQENVGWKLTAEINFHSALTLLVYSARLVNWLQAFGWGRPNRARTDTALSVADSLWSVIAPELGLKNDSRRARLKQYTPVHRTWTCTKQLRLH